MRIEKHIQKLKNGYGRVLQTGSFAKPYYVHHCDQKCVHESPTVDAKTSFITTMESSHIYIMLL